MDYKKFKINEKVRIRLNGKVGTVRSCYDAWMVFSTADYEYAIELDDNSGVITVSENALEKIDYDTQPQLNCSCGAKFTSFSDHHMSWCNLFKKEEKS